MAEYDLIIDGKRVPAESSFSVINPATEGSAGECPIASAEQLDAAVAAAARAFETWSVAPDEERAAACGRVAQALQEHAEEIAQILTREQGKPLNGAGSRFELGGAAAWAGFPASLSLPEKIIQDDDNVSIVQRRKPIGVVGSITPWNWPVMIAIWHIMPAVRTGNTVVIKPSPYTPLSTLRMVERINEVLPPGVVNCVTGRDELGAWMTSHPGIQKMIFTGSINTGKKVMSSSAETLKRVTLELGGNDAGIVLDDVNPAEIAPGIIQGSFINNGQTCAALKRLYVHESVYDELCDELSKAATGAKMGDGSNEETEQGPIQNKMQYDKVVGLYQDAVANGGRVLCGGEIPDGPGYFMPFTLVADVTDGMPIVDEEQFGPILPIIKYSDIDEALQHANGLDTGLGGSVWSSDPARGAAVAAQLECGSAWVNSHGGIAPNVPFGGVKCSGIGVEFGEEGLLEYTTIQTVTTPKAATA